MAAPRHSALASYGRHLPRLYHHEPRGFRSSPVSIVSQQQRGRRARGFSSSRSLASSWNPLTPLLFEDLRTEMLERPEQQTYDTLSPTPSFLLDVALADYLDEPVPHSTGVEGEPPSYAGLRPKYPWPVMEDAPAAVGASKAPPPPYTTLKQGYHLIHFPLALPPSGLCPDGTDPFHAPGLGWGEVFERRMWAGGGIEFKPERPLRLQPPIPSVAGATLAACKERILDVTLRGLPGDEKIFVDVLRQYDWARPKLKYNHATKQNELRPSELPQGKSGSVVEVRTLVFMRKEDKQKQQPQQGHGKGSYTVRSINLPFEPTYQQSLVPDRTLLFQFSALSYNAHLIHLDERYSQDVEGRPGLLVHGPLCLILMLKVLRRSHRARLAKRGDVPVKEWSKKKKPKSIGEETGELLVSKIEYRNIAPLFVGDKMTVCVRSPNGSGHGQRHDVWIVNQHGGLCVKGSVVTV